jgi:hypothetical protein
MSKAKFQVRSPERDRKNDDFRIERLDKVLEDVMAEVRRERSGFRARYESSADSEIYPLDSLMRGKIAIDPQDGVSLAQCIERLRKLDEQENVLRQMQHDLSELQGLTAA